QQELQDRLGHGKGQHDPHHKRHHRPARSCSTILVRQPPTMTIWPKPRALRPPKARPQPRAKSLSPERDAKTKFENRAGDRRGFFSFFGILDRASITAKHATDYGC
ncbi:MAG: hypothetical protein AAFY49_03050, partial [Pseudomonadota bacterium]